MNSQEPKQRGTLERRLRAHWSRGFDPASSIWPALAQRIGGRTPFEIERGERRRELRFWTLAVASLLVALLALQGLWSPGPMVSPSPSSAGIPLLEDILGLTRIEEDLSSPANVLTALIDEEVSR